MYFNSKKVVLKGIFSKQGEKRRRFPNYPLQNYEENRIVLKSSSTKGNDSDINHRKKAISWASKFNR